MKPSTSASAAAALLGVAGTLFLIEDALLGGPLSPRRGTWWSTLIQHGPAVCVSSAALLVAARLGWLQRVRLPRPSIDVLTRVATRGIPPASPQAVAAFRIAFACGLLYFLREHRIPNQDALRLITCVALVLFGCGLWARGALVVATFGIWVWMIAWTRDFGSHPVAALVIALPCLWPARWSDAWSLDAILWRRTREARSIRYGYAIWMPRFVIGVALLAAAVAKLLTPGWIANGTVKFAFVADYHRASVPWGLWIASHPTASVVASGAAVIIEAAAITAAFSRSWVYRLAVGGGVAVLFAGFYLLQGELWLGWWILLMAFLPWERIASADTAVTVSAGLSRSQWAAIVLLAATQIVASVARLEIRPALSAYDMYSTTFPSTAAFDRENPMLDFRFEAQTADGRWIDVSECFDRPRSSEAAATWGRDVVALRRVLTTCDPTPDPGIRRLRLIESLRAFDWQTGRFFWKYRGVERWSVPV